MRTAYILRFYRTKQQRTKLYGIMNTELNNLIALQAAFGGIAETGREI
jgi:hypothetical protein